MKPNCYGELRLVENVTKKKLAKNGLPAIKYSLEHNTAQAITNIICAANSAHHIPSNFSHQGASAQTNPNNQPPASNTAKKSKEAQTQKSSKRRTSSITKFSNDANKSHKRKGSAPSQLAVEDGVFSMDETATVNMIRKKQDKKSTPPQIPALNKQKPTIGASTTFGAVRDELRHTTLHLSEKMRHLMKPGVTAHKSRLSLNQIMQLLNQGEINMEGARRRQLTLDAGVLQNTEYADLELSVNLSCPIAMGSRNSDCQLGRGFLLTSPKTQHYISTLRYSPSQYNTTLNH